jgi:lipoyl synthase
MNRNEISPEFVQTSLAASLTLGLQTGSFHRNARLTGLNLLLHYDEGCQGRCHFCGLSRSRPEGPRGKTFIRVEWPVYPLDEIISRAKNRAQLERVCVSMITHPRALEDTLTIVRRLKKETDLPISVLASPTLIREPASLKRLSEAGADRVGIAIDAATPVLFDRLRGSAVGGPHRWEHYWDILQMAVEVFGRFFVGIHLIVGLGETEREMVEAIQKAQDLGASTHLFSFYPEKGSPMEKCAPPSLDRYRRIQLARWIVNEGRGSYYGMDFDETGRVIDFGIDTDPLIRMGKPFMTSGCPGKSGKVACNRPYGNERPSGPIRNFPFPPEPEDMEEIRTQLTDSRSPE